MRGDTNAQRSSTLTDLTALGIRLEFVDREHYYQRSSPHWLQQLQEKFGPHHWIPEGGSGPLGVQGMYDFALGLRQCPLPHDYSVPLFDQETAALWPTLAALRRPVNDHVLPHPWSVVRHVH